MLEFKSDLIVRWLRRGRHRCNGDGCSVKPGDALCSEDIVVRSRQATIHHISARSVILVVHGGSLDA